MLHFHPMKFLVGGSVRDKLLGRVPRDTDYLLVGEREDELIRKGFHKVGQSFSIYLDPKNGDEYSLADSLEADLKRRDLTINAMAIDEEGKLIDLFGGEADLHNKILRHVGRENFFTDPLRVMRVARFQARFPDFSIHPETLTLMKEVAATSAFESLLNERIIKELKSVFECPRPSLFFRTLESIGALGPHFPHIEDLSLLDYIAKKDDLQFAAYVSELNPETLLEMKERLNIQNDWYELARAWVIYRNLVQTPDILMNYFYETDAFRKPWIISKLMELGANLLRPYEKIKDVGIKDVDSSLKGKAIADAIRDKRLSILKGRS